MIEMNSIFMVAHSQYRFLFLKLAERLRQNYGSQIHLFCGTKQEVDFYRANSKSDTFSSFAVNNVLYRAAREPVEDETEVLAEAHLNEAWIGATINSLALTDRHLGRGYSLAGFNHPRSHISEETSYFQMVRGFNAAIDFWRQQISEKSPSLMINCGKIAALICHAEGIECRILAGSRYKNLHQWTHNEFFENPRIEEAYKRIEKSGLAAEIASPYLAHMTLRKKFIRGISRTRLLIRTLYIILRHFYWKYKRYEKAHGYYLSHQIRYAWRQRSHTRKLIGSDAKSLESLNGKRFVFYPLHTEPETALHTLSPEYFYQLSCIAAVSRDLPAGVVLAVKESYEAIGRRPSDFYDQIREFKNVVMLDMMELGLEVVRKCDAVVTIAGTAGFEAAVMGKPVISFGCHNQYGFLPHIWQVSDERQLGFYLHEALGVGFNAAKAVRDGARFLKAIHEVSFDMKDYDYIQLDRFDDSVVDGAVQSLTESLAA